MNEGISVRRATTPRRVRAVAVATIAAGMLIVPAGVARAHESREVGDLTLVVGWSNEPAYAGFGNEVQVVVTETRGERPVEDGELEAEVVFGEGGASTQATLDPAFSTPNEYLGYIIPTRPGTYTFNVSGTVGGETIEETFTSGPDTFNDVQNPADAEFPEQDPTRGEIAEALDRLSGRIEELGAQEPADEGSDVALWVAIGAGVLALIAVVLAARRRSA
ncbi:MAG: hypothetical protein ACRDH1_04225 [Actinomycetota bacterium]